MVDTTHIWFTGRGNPFGWPQGLHWMHDPDLQRHPGHRAIASKLGEAPSKLTRGYSGRFRIHRNQGDNTN